MSVTVRDNRATNRYEVLSGGEVAGFAEYALRGHEIALFNTEIAGRFDGQGLGSILAEAALADARARGLKVVPTCEFIAGHIRAHPDRYLDLVVRRMRKEVMAER